MSLEAFQAGVYAAALILCLLFASMAARSALTKRYYLTAFFLAEAFGVLCEWLLLLSESGIRWLWLALLMTGAFWTAPCLWHFAQSYSPRKVLGAADRLAPQLWEYILPLAGAVLCIPLFLASDALFKRPSEGWLVNSIHPTMSLCACLFIVQVMIYWNKTLQIFKQEQHAVKRFYASLTQPLLGLLRILLLLVVANWLASLIRTANVWFWQSNAEVGIVAVLIEYLIMLSGFFFLFHGNLPTPTPVVQAPYDDAPPSERREPADTDISAISEDKEADRKSAKYAKASLSDAVTRRIEEKLNDREQLLPFIRDNGISLDKLAASLGEKSYYVSQVLNQQLNTTFYEYVNALRIHEVCRRLIDEPKEKIFDIALDLGFNSKSTFNTAFKHQLGMTPSSFRSQQLKRSDNAPS